MTCGLVLGTKRNYSFEDWYNSTYGLGIDFDIVMYKGHRPFLAFEVEEVSTLWEGRCYTVTVNQSMMPVRDILTVAILPLNNSEGKGSMLNSVVFTVFEEKDKYLYILRSAYSFKRHATLDAEIKIDMTFIGTLLFWGTGKARACIPLI